MASKLFSFIDKLSWYLQSPVVDIKTVGTVRFLTSKLYRLKERFLLEHYYTYTNVISYNILFIRLD